jgi:trehalose 6-phosphate synthase/phosphatase
MAKKIIVSNRLPVKAVKKKNKFVFTSSEGGLATGLGSIYTQENNIWIGWPGLEVIEDYEQKEVSEKLKELNLLPVFLSQEEINQYYEGFSNEVLWPVFHYMPTYAKYKQSYWDYYYKVNLKFKEAIIQIAEPGDTIWIHDYQLLLLPAMLRSEFQNISIGFFQHIPFPSYELFRLIPWRAELLEGMLGADLIGFHTFDDAHHFTIAATRILPVQSSSNLITINDRSVVVESFPMGIDSKKFEMLTSNDEVILQINNLRKNFQQAKIVVSIDRLDYSKGILQRLLAFELLLQLYPEYIEKIVLYMIVVPSRDTVPQYKKLHDDIDKLVGNINATFRTMNWHPVQYFYRSFPIETLSALYNVADVCLVTPMRDGMNLVCKEYVASRVKNDGVLILSEMAGASKELIDALVVNPNNIGAITSALVEALHMPLTEQQRRMKQMRQLVSKFNIDHWVKLFMTRLLEAKQQQQSSLTRHINGEVLDRIKTLYNQAGKRVLYLDYDGTLVGFKTNIDMAFPDQELYDLLHKLSADPANNIVIISGRNHKTLEEWFKGIRLDLIAEHGVWQKRHHEQQWQSIPGINNKWKPEIQSILDIYTDRTPGSFVEEKSFSLVWHYRKVAEGLGELRANELVNTLRYIIEGKGLQVLQGNKVIEIKNIEVNKGKAALSRMQNNEYDFILAVGDDQTDEDIFKAMPPEAVTIKVGSQISAANHYVRSYHYVRQLLKQLATTN